jgi:hypothetical protein
MTDPRRPDDARLSTADLAAANDRVVERDVTRETRQPQQGVVADASTQREMQRENQREGGSDHDRATPLFAGNEAEDFRHRLTDIQAGFVDEPRQAVQNADALVAQAIKRLAEIFAQERSTLEQQWAQGADVSTEDLRVALQRYRSFFDRLLSV